MKTFIWNQCSDSLKQELLQRPVQAVQKELTENVTRIIDQIKADGDTALRALTRRFDGVELAGFKVTEQEFQQADASVSDELKACVAEEFCVVSILLVYMCQQVPPRYRRQH